jgi:hypothetical protein
VIERQAVSRSTPDNPPVITSSDVVRALAGVSPPRNKPMSAGRLGELLAPHRHHGQFVGKPFSRQAICGYAHPEKYAKADGTPQFPITAEFAWAFWAWREAEKSGGSVMVIGTDGLNLEEIVGDAGVAYWVGEGNPQKIVVVGEIPAGSVIHLNGSAALLSTDGLQKRTCAGCGQDFLGWGRKRYHSRECATKARRERIRLEKARGLTGG